MPYKSIGGTLIQTDALIFVQPDNEVEAKHSRQIETLSRKLVFDMHQLEGIVESDITDCTKLLFNSGYDIDVDMTFKEACNLMIKSKSLSYGTN